MAAFIDARESGVDVEGVAHREAAAVVAELVLHFVGVHAHGHGAEAGVVAAQVTLAVLEDEAGGVAVAAQHGDAAVLYLEDGCPSLLRVGHALVLAVYDEPLAVLHGILSEGGHFDLLRFPVHRLPAQN